MHMFIDIIDPRVSPEDGTSPWAGIIPPSLCPETAHIFAYFFLSCGKHTMEITPSH